MGPQAVKRKVSLCNILHDEHRTCKRSTGRAASGPPPSRPNRTGATPVSASPSPQRALRCRASPHPAAVPWLLHQRRAVHARAFADRGSGESKSAECALRDAVRRFARVTSVIPPPSYARQPVSFERTSHKNGCFPGEFRGFSTNSRVLRVAFLFWPTFNHPVATVAAETHFVPRLARRVTQSWPKAQLPPPEKHPARVRS